MSGGQYLLWMAEYEDQSRAAVKTLERKGYEFVEEEMFLATGPFTPVAEQLRMPLEVLRQVIQIAIEAWRTLPTDKEKTSSLANVKQGPDEKYEDFVSRLITAISRLISNEEVSEVLIKQLAFENANPTCQALLRPIKNSGNVTDYIKQCTDVSPAFIQGVAIAAALKGKTYSQFMEDCGTKEAQTGKRLCYNCRQPGHLCKQCPNKAQNNNGNNLKNNIPRPICPRCEKGFHWAKDCKSQFHKDGHPLENNAGNSGNSHKGPTPRPQTTIGVSTLNPFMPFVPSQNSSEQPQGVQDWTSLPPPQQY